MDRAEARGGERGEHARMSGDGLRDALAAEQPGADQVAGITLIDGRAGRTDTIAAVAARHKQNPARLGGGVVHRAQFTGGQVYRIDTTAQVQRVGTLPGAVGVAQSLSEIGPRDGCLRPRTSMRSGADGAQRGSGQMPLRDSGADSMACAGAEVAKVAVVIVVGRLRRGRLVR